MAKWARDYRFIFSFLRWRKNVFQRSFWSRSCLLYQVIWMSQSFTKKCTGNKIRYWSCRIGCLLAACVVATCHSPYTRNGSHNPALNETITDKVWQLWKEISSQSNLLNIRGVCFYKKRGFSTEFRQISAKLTFLGYFPFQSMWLQTHTI